MSDVLLTLRNLPGGRMSVDAVIGVDIGTSSSKGVLVGESGQVLGSAVREHQVNRPAPGWVEMPASVWWDGVLLHHPRTAHRHRRGGDRGRGQRHGAVHCADGRDRRGGTSGHPLRGRQSGHRPDREDQRRLRHPSHHRPMRLRVDQPGRRPQDRLDCRERAARIRRRSAALHAELLSGPPSHRRVRTRPSLGEPVRSAVRHRRPDLVRPMVERHRRLTGTAGTPVGQ